MDNEDTESANSSPIAISLSSYFAPRFQAGAFIGVLSAADPDENETFSFSTSPGIFEVVEIGGVWYLKLSDASLLYDAIGDSIPVKIKVTDSAGNEFSELLTIHTPSQEALLVNSTITQSQNLSAMTRLSDGGWIVTWADEFSSPETTYAPAALKYQRYNKDGEKVGEETTIQTGSGDANVDSSDLSSRVVTLDDGWLIVWQAGSVDNSDPNNPSYHYDIFYQRFDNAGNQLNEERVTVNETPLTQANEYAPSAVTLDDGGWIISWVNPTTDGNNSIHFQRFDRDGRKAGAETSIPTSTDWSHAISSLAALPDGGWIITWRSQNSDNGTLQTNSYYQRYNNLGEADEGGSVLLDSFASDTFAFCQVITLDNGGWLILTETQPSDSERTLHDIYFQRFDPQGQAVGEKTFVTDKAYAHSGRDLASVTMIHDGGWIVVWQADSQSGTLYGTPGGKGLDIYFRRYSKTGEALGSIERVNFYTQETQTAPSLVAMEDGGWLITYSSENQLKNTDEQTQYDIFSQRYDKNGNKVFLDGSGANHNSPPFDLSLEEQSVLEGQKGVIISELSFKDIDKEFLPTFTIQGSDLFEIVAGRDQKWYLKLKDGVALDYKVAASHKISINITDSANSRYSEEFIIDVLESNEFRVNNLTEDTQYDPEVTFLADGGWVVVWQGNTGGFNGYQIYYQRYSKTGVKLDQDVVVNSFDSFDQLNPSVTALADGGWIVTWTSNVQDGYGYGIFYRHYDKDGIASSESDIRVNITKTSNQEASSVTALADGGWIITWTSDGQDGSYDGIYYQRYDQSGTALFSSDMRVNQETDNTQSASSVVALADGGWIVTWQSYTQDGDLYGIFYQRYDKDGIATSETDIPVNKTTENQQFNPSVTALIDGGWVIVWQGDNADGDGYGIYYQLYTKDGVAHSQQDIAVATSMSTIQANPALTSLSDGGWVITWLGDDPDPDRSGAIIYYQRYNNEGVATSAEAKVVTTDLEDTSRSLAISALSDGGWVISWYTDKGDGQDQDIYSLRFDRNGVRVSVDYSDPNPPLTDITLTNTDIVEGTAGTIIDTLSATGPLGVTVSRFSVVNGSDIFEVLDNDGVWQLKLKDDVYLNANVKNSYLVTIQATASNGSLYNESFTINVIDSGEENGAPTDLHLEGNSIAENSAGGTTIGNLSAIDPDPHDILSFSVINSDLFETSNLDGTWQLTLKQGALLDYESRQSYNITLKVTDYEGLSYEKEVSINITDVNEAPYNISLTGNSVNENTPGAFIGTLNASDPDSGATLTYSVVSDTNFVTVNTGGVWQLRLKDHNQLNYEENQSVTVVVRVSDEHNLYTDKTFKISVIDLPEQPTDISLTNTTINENSAAGTVIGQLSATDPDGDPNLNYTITRGSDYFALIKSDNGLWHLALKDGVTLDYESQNSYAITLQVTDSDQLSYEKDFLIDVSDINEAPSLSVSNVLATSIARGSTTPVKLVELSALDPENKQLEYTISAKDEFNNSISSDLIDSLFVVSEDDSGLFLRFRGNANTDYRNINRFILTLTAYDPEGISQSLTTPITIDVTLPITNHKPEAIELTTSTEGVSIDGTTVNVSNKNSLTLGSLLVTMDAVDDLGTNYRWSLADYTENHFLINETTGAITLNTENLSGSFTLDIILNDIDTGEAGDNFTLTQSITIFFDNPIYDKNGALILEGNGQSNDDVFVFSSGTPSVNLGKGNDKAYAGDGNNAIYLGDGDDEAIDLGGTNTIDAGSGNDRTLTLSGTNTISGEEGNDVLLGGWGDDNLSGGGGHDALAGDLPSFYFNGDDKLEGGTGNDLLMGGSGADTFIFAPGGGHDTIGRFNVRNIWNDWASREGDISGLVLSRDFTRDDSLDLSAFGYSGLDVVRGKISSNSQGNLEFSDVGTIITLIGVSYEELFELTIII